MFLFGSVLGGAGSIVIGILPQQGRIAATMIAGGVVLVLVFMGVYGLARLIILTAKLARPKHVIRCPNCAARYKMYRTESFYRCPACLLPIHFSGETAATEKMACANCQHSFGVDASATSVRCANCGAVLKQGAQYKDLDHRICQRCHTRIEMGIFFCPRCVEITSPVDEALLNTTNDAQLARGTLGVALHVHASLLQHPAITTQVRDTTNWATMLEKMLVLMERIFEGLLLNDPNCRPHLARIENLLDVIYATSLMRAFMFMERNPNRKYPDRIMGRLFLHGQPAIYRKQIHDFVTGVAPAGAGGVGVAQYSDWTRPLFDPCDYTAKQKDATAPFEYQITNPHRLKGEALRIRPATASLVR